MWSKKKRHNKFKNTIMKTLIAYYSKRGENWFDCKKTILEKGNSEIIASYLKEFITDSTMLYLHPIKEYSNDYDKCCIETLYDQQNNIVRELEDLPISIDEYDVIYLIYPIYWSSLPMPILSFLKKYDFKNKIIYPISTHEGSGMGASVSIIKNNAKNATVLDPLPIIGTLVNKAKNKIKRYVESH